MEIRYRVDRPNEKRNDLYHGLDTISKLCCGDISVLLDVFRKIFITGDVKPDSHNLVSANHQHHSILAVSREFHDYIRNYRPHGADMYSIADNFGKLSRRILHEGKPSVIKGKLSYPQTTRILVEEHTSDENTELSPRLNQIKHELLRRTIFIELEPSRARDGITKTIRWQLRPILCPYFETSLSNRFSIQWDPEQFKFFLSSPTEACNNEFMTRWKMSNKNLEKFDKNINANGDLSTLKRWDIITDEEEVDDEDDL